MLDVLPLAVAAAGAAVGLLRWRRCQCESSSSKAAAAAAAPAAPRPRPSLFKRAKKQKKYPRHELAAAEPSWREELVRLFPAIKKNWQAPTLDYTQTIKGGLSRYKKWNISCYLRVWDGWTPRTESHMPLVRVMDPVLDRCNELFEAWYKKLHGLSDAEVIIMNSFVTRYRAGLEGEDQLKKHVDGRKVDGSLVLALPTDEPFEGGKLVVWDGPDKAEHTYYMKPGDALFLDNMVWHQAFPITAGVRWALVIFYKVKWKGVAVKATAKTAKKAV